MTSDRVQAEVVQLLHEHVESYEDLEVLLVLARDSSRWRSVQMIASDAAVAEEAVAGTLNRFARTDLLERAEHEGAELFRAAPRAVDLLETLAKGFEDHRVEIINLMTHNALERVRTSALRTFAASFLLGRKRDG